jgi:hypothetical protein
MAQTSFGDWLAQNLGISVLVLVLIQIIIIIIYCKMYFKIVRQGIGFRLFRNGRLIREGKNGGLVLMIPFFDRLETEGGVLRPIDNQYIRGFVVSVPPGKRYLHVRKGIPIRECHEGERIFRLPFFDWIEVMN